MFESWFDPAFDAALQGLHLSSSVGKGSMSKFGSVVRDVLKHDGIDYDPIRVSMLRVLVKSKCVDLIRGDYAPDPINVFIKPEPHKLSKIEEGRERLISAVSLEDSMIDRMLYREFQARNQQEITPVKQMYSPRNGGFIRLASAFPQGSLSIDKKNWDFTVPKWMVFLWRDFLEDLIGGTCPDWWRRLHRGRFEALFGPDVLFVFPDGAMAKQGFWGIMKSGCFNTLFLNSVGQVIIALLAKKRLGLSFGEFWTVGDDTVEEIPPNVESYLAEIEKLGFMVKQADVNRHVEFCGFLVDHSQIRPAYWKKHLFKVLYSGGPHWVEMLTVYSFLYAFEPSMYDFVSEVLYVSKGIIPVPRELWQLVWRGLV